MVSTRVLDQTIDMNNGTNEEVSTPEDSSEVVGADMIKT